MTDLACLRPSRSSHFDAACWMATSEHSPGEHSPGEHSPGEQLPGASVSQPSISDASVYSTAMTTDLSPLTVDLVDFYELIDQPHNATTVQLRSRINELYAEAQVNRDHRNVEKRHQYARLLQSIPPLRSILLHEGKRAKYDALLAKSQNGDTDIDFRTALNDLLGENEFDFGEGESILGLRDVAMRDAATPAVAQAEPEPRLSSRLDAVAAAAGEGAARANITATSGTIDTVPRANVAATNVAATNIANADAAAPPSAVTEATSPPLATSPTVAPVSAPNATASASDTRPAASSTRSSSTRTSSKVALNPALVRERASLMASAIGVSVLFVVLLTLRTMLGVESNLPVLVGIALVAGFVAWSAVRRTLLSRLPTK